LGVRYGQRRHRLESLKNPGDTILFAIGVNDINLEKYDEQVIYDDINKRIDAVEKKLKERVGFVR